ncbi:MAG: hypothetical protein R3246_16535, partial [Acidimicrobiia bacterium]|nr:hypothetical protein [Acidimicrobiia bacterium]
CTPAGSFDIEGDWSEYSFTFADGSVVTGSNAFGEAGWTGSKNEADLGLSEFVHVSCSDDFPGGWGEKGGPVQGVDPFGIVDFEIFKYKDGHLDKTCTPDPGAGDPPTGDPTEPAAIALEKFVGETASGPWFEADDLAGAPEIPTGSDVYFRFEVSNPGGGLLTAISVSDPGFDLSGCTFTDLAPGESAACVIGPFPAGADANTNTATVTATVPGPPTVDATGDGSQYIFVFADGTVISGSNQPGQPGHTGTGNEANLGLAQPVHVSCSDGFGYDDDDPTNDGWGEKGSPVQGVDPSPVVTWYIAKFKGGGVDKFCGDESAAGELIATDSATYVGVGGQDPASIKIIKVVDHQLGDGSFAFSFAGPGSP